jgi:hypothetical protein
VDAINRESLRTGLLPVAASHPASWLGAGKCPFSPTPDAVALGRGSYVQVADIAAPLFDHLVGARNTINGGT